MSCFLISSTVLFISVVLETLQFNYHLPLNHELNWKSSRSPHVYVQQFSVGSDDFASYMVGKVCAYNDIFMNISIFGLMAPNKGAMICPSVEEVGAEIQLIMMHPSNVHASGNIERSNLLSISSIYFDTWVVVNKTMGHISISSSERTVWYLSRDEGKAGGLRLSSCPLSASGAKFREYNFKLRNKTHVSLDQLLFAASLNQGVGDNDVADATYDYSDICQLLERMEHGASFGSTFTLDSRYNMDYFGLAYWMEACRSSPLTVHVREIDDEPMHVQYVYQKSWDAHGTGGGAAAAASMHLESHDHTQHYCTVKFVSGRNVLLSSYRDAGNAAPGGPLHCIQDVFVELLDRSSGANFLTFVSSMGFADMMYQTNRHRSTTDSNGMSTLKMGLLFPSSLQELRSAEYWELLEVLKGFDDMSGAHLHLTSVVALLAQQHSLDVNQKSSVSDTDAIDRNDELIVVDGDDDIFGHFGLDAAGNPVSCFPLDKYKCVVHADNIVDSFNPVDSSGDVNFMNTETISPEFTTHMLLTNGFADTHVLLFVDETDSEIALAERVVNSWRFRSQTQMAIRYSIIPVAGLGQPEPRGSRGNVSKYEYLVGQDVGNKYASHLPMHSVLLHVQHWISHISGQFDLIVVLVGLESIFSLDHGGIRGSGGGDADGTETFKGFIPEFSGGIPEGKQFFRSLRYHIPSPLVFSARAGQSATERQPGCAALRAYYSLHASNNLDADICNLNVFAFGGTALSVSKMIAKLRRSSANVPHGYALSLHEVNWHLLSQLKRLAVRYVANNYATLDIHSQFFKLGSRGSALSYAFNSFDFVGGGHGFMNKELNIGGLFADEDKCHSDCHGRCQDQPFSLGEDANPEMFIISPPASSGTFVVNYAAVDKSHLQGIQDFAQRDLIRGISRSLFALERLLKGPSPFEFGLDNCADSWLDSVSTPAWVNSTWQAGWNASYSEAQKAAFIPVYGLMLETLALKYVAGRLEPEQLQRAVELLNTYLKNRAAPGAAVFEAGRDVIIVRSLLASLLLESGHELEGRKVFSSGLIPVPFSVVVADRQRWKKDKTRLSPRRPATSSIYMDAAPDGRAGFENVSSDMSSQTHASKKTLPSGTKRQQAQSPHTHFITVASDENAELGHLRASAELISGVSLTAVGVGKKYSNFGNKVHWVYDHLVAAMTDGGPTSPAIMLEDDVVVFMDAYDVVMFPTVRNIARDFSTAPTPIVFCTEHGIYPEFNSAWSYYRETPFNENYFSSRDANVNKTEIEREREREDYIREHFAHEALQAKQLNSGCYIGRAKQVVEMLKLIAFQADYVPDDQWLFVRYAQSNPQLVSLDTDRTYFRTAYRQFLDWKHVGVSVDFQMISLPVENLHWFTVKQYNEEFVHRSWEHSVKLYHQRNVVILRHLKQLIVQSISSKSGSAAGGGMDVLGNHHHVPNAVHILHCNNKGSNSLYDSSTHAMYDIYNEYYNQTDLIHAVDKGGSNRMRSHGAELLRVNWLIVDLAFEEAIQVLYGDMDFRLVHCGEPANTPLGFERARQSVLIDTDSSNAIGPTILSEKQVVLICYYRFKLDIALRHHEMTGLYSALLPAITPDMIPSDSYVTQMMYHIIPAFLYLLPR